MVDALFGVRRLARVYDALDAERGDLGHYVAMVGEFGAGRVVDVGCGTGELAGGLGRLGVEVVGVDPAEASLEVARGKEFADRVRWIHGDATTLPPLEVDLAVMTGNVAQVFLTDEDWAATLSGIRDAVRPGGRFVFETRDPARRGWEEWTRDQTHQVTEVGSSASHQVTEVGSSASDQVTAVGASASDQGGETVESWTDLISVELPFVSFRGTFVFGSDGAVLTSDSTLRFRERDELEESLTAAGFAVDDVREAPDRPGKEFVFVSSRL